MMQDEKFIRCITKENRKNVMSLAWELSGSLLNEQDMIYIELWKPKRSDEQNRKLHAMLGEIAKRHTFNGQKLNAEQWKMIFVSGHAIATGGKAEMAIGLEGEVINLRESTAKMSVSRLSSLIEYIYAWAVNEGFEFHDEITRGLG